MRSLTLPTGKPAHPSSAQTSATFGTRLIDVANPSELL